MFSILLELSCMNICPVTFTFYYQFIEFIEARSTPPRYSLRPNLFVSFVRNLRCIELIDLNFYSQSFNKRSSHFGVGLELHAHNLVIPNIVQLLTLRFSHSSCHNPALQECNIYIASWVEIKNKLSVGASSKFQQYFNN